MEILIEQFVQRLPLSFLFVYIAVSLLILGKSADLLVIDGRHEKHKDKGSRGIP